MPAHIMVFNDDQATLDMYGMFLELFGYTPFLYLHPHVNQATLDDAKPDLILLDWMLGYEEIGIQTVKRLRANPTAETTPMIVCTVRTPAEMQRHKIWLESMDIPILHKPFDLAELEELIAAQLNKSHST